MDWLVKLYEIIKIPLKIALPATWLFSGTLTLINDSVLKRLNLLEWKTENGFVFGLLFLITSCLILIYIVYYLKEKVSDIIFKLTLNRKTIKRLTTMDDTRLAILISMYHSPGYSKVLNYTEPLVQALFAEGYIYYGSEQLVSMNMLTNEVPVKFTLQPFVYRALDYYNPKMKEEIGKLSRKVTSQKNENKKSMIQEKLEILKDYYDTFYNGGF